MCNSEVSISCGNASRTECKKHSRQSKLKSKILGVFFNKSSKCFFNLYYIFNQRIELHNKLVGEKIYKSVIATVTEGKKQSQMVLTALKFSHIVTFICAYLLKQSV